MTYGPGLDEGHFSHKSKSLFMQAAPKAINPLQAAISLQAGGEQTRATRIVSRFFT
jgi:hypothetical protein